MAFQEGVISARMSQPRFASLACELLTNSKYIQSMTGNHMLACLDQQLQSCDTRVTQPKEEDIEVPET